MRAVLPAVVLISWATELSAQHSDDAVARLKACSQLARDARLDCMEKLSRDVLSTERVFKRPNEDNWVVSETTSPLDYSPQVIASNSSHADAADAPSLITVSCRAGRTEFVINIKEAWGFPGGIRDVGVSYRINNESLVEQRWRMSPSGRGLSYPGDVIRLLRSMPNDGTLLIRVSDRQGVSHENSFALTGVAYVRDKLAAACRWPPAQGPVAGQ